MSSSGEQSFSFRIADQQRVTCCGDASAFNPTCLGDYRDLERSEAIVPDASGKRFLVPSDERKLPFNLLEGFAKAQFSKFVYTDAVYNIDQILQFIVLKKRRNDIREAEFCTRRGMLKTLLNLTVPQHYDRQHKHCFVAIKFHATVYLAAYFSPEMREMEAKELQKPFPFMFSYCGHQFEKCISKFGQGGWCNRDCRWHQMFSCDVGGTKLLYSAEIDAWDEKRQAKVELKTMGDNITDAVKRRKLADACRQSMFSDVKRLVVGMRRHNVGQYYQDRVRVHFVEQYDINDLMENGGLDNTWYGKQPAAAALNALLTSIQRVVTEDDPYTAYLFTHEPDSGQLSYEVLRDDVTFCFLPHWYIKWVEPNFDRRPLREGTEEMPK